MSLTPLVYSESEKRESKNCVRSELERLQGEGEERTLDQMQVNLGDRKCEQFHDNKRKNVKWAVLEK